MSLLRHKALYLVLATFGAAALFGGTLGATAGSRPALSEGFNLIGGPLGGSVTPDKFVSCLPGGSWQAIYTWDGAEQEWTHFFDTSGTLPDYLNDTDVGGMSSIGRLAGVVVIMNSAVANPFFPENSSDACP